MYSVKTPDDGQRNCPKHVEFYSKNKFEKLVHLVGFIIRIYLKEVGWEGVDWIHLVKDGDKKRALANKVINLHFA